VTPDRPSVRCSSVVWAARQCCTSTERESVEPRVTVPVSPGFQR
jgi:hypothetical protein